MKHSKDDVNNLTTLSSDYNIAKIKTETMRKDSIHSILNNNNGCSSRNNVSTNWNYLSHSNNPMTNVPNNNNSIGNKDNGGLEASLDSLSDMINVTLQQAYTAPPLTELGSEIIAKNVDQLDPHNTAPLMSLDEMLNDINHVSSSDTQLWKEISDQAMWLGDTMDPTSAVRTDMYYKDVLNNK